MSDTPSRGPGGPVTGKRLLLVYAALVLCIFLPPIVSVTLQQQDTPLLVREILVQTIAAYMWLSPAIHILTVILLSLLWRYGGKVGRIADAFFGVLFLFFALGQNIAVTPTYGFAVLTGNLAIMLVVGVWWVWEVYRPSNEYVFHSLPWWRYWVVPFAVLAFWFPVDMNVNLDLNPLLLLTSSYGVAFCPTVPVVVALLTLVYPKVNRDLLGVTSFAGLLIGSFNVLSLFVMPGYTVWLFIVHIPLIIIPLYGLIIPKMVAHTS